MSISDALLDRSLAVAEPSHAPEHPRQPTTEPKRSFLVIEGGFDRVAQWARRFGTTLLVTFIIGLVGALFVHATIIENQKALDTQRRDIEALVVDTDSLRNQLAELEAPARVVSEALELGMIEPPSVLYLNTPAGPLDDRLLAAAASQLGNG